MESKMDIVWTEVYLKLEQLIEAPTIFERN